MNIFNKNLIYLLCVICFRCCLIDASEPEKQIIDVDQPSEKGLQTNNIEEIHEYSETESLEFPLQDKDAELQRIIAIFEKSPFENVIKDKSESGKNDEFAKPKKAKSIRPKRYVNLGINKLLESALKFLRNLEHAGTIQNDYTFIRQLDLLRFRFALSNGKQNLFHTEKTNNSIIYGFFAELLQDIRYLHETEQLAQPDHQQKFMTMLVYTYNSINVIGELHNAIISKSLIDGIYEKSNFESAKQEIQDLREFIINDVPKIINIFKEYSRLKGVKINNNKSTKLYTL